MGFLSPGGFMHSSHAFLHRLDALVDLTKAVDLEPTYYLAYYLKGILHMKLKDYHSTKEAIELGSACAPGDPDLIS